MRGWLPILVLGACLAAVTFPAAAGDTRPGTWVETYDPSTNGSVWQWQGETPGDDQPPNDGTSVPPPSGPTTEVTPAGVTVIRGGYTNALTVDEAADGVTIVRGPGQHH